MKVFRDIENFHPKKKQVLTVGSFDGVHQGHLKILHQLKSIAQEIEGESVILTFDPHPRQVIGSDNSSLKLINSPEEKIERFREIGIDNLIIIPFTPDFANLSENEYIEDFIIKWINPEVFVIGYDHRFGKGRTGDLSTLLQYSEKHNCFKVVEIQKRDIEEITVSSTKIRNALNEGKITLANKLLGYNFSIKGTVVKGKQLGTQLGFPTANLQTNFAPKIIPSIGIYATKVLLNNAYYWSMTYIGNRPTINSTDQPVIEVNIFDFKGNIYSSEVELVFFEKIREDNKFESLEELKKMLVKDEEKVRNYFYKIQPIL